VDATPRHQDPSQGYARVAQAVVGDIGRGGKTAADALLPGGGPGADRPSRAAFVQHVRDLWPDPVLREGLFRRFVPSIANPVAKDPTGKDARIPARNGLSYWEALIKEAFPLGYPEPAPMLAPMVGADVGGVPGPMPGPMTAPGGFNPAPLGGEQMA
jgi:hypothetical protein